MRDFQSDRVDLGRLQASNHITEAVRLAKLCTISNLTQLEDEMFKTTPNSIRSLFGPESRPRTDSDFLEVDRIYREAAIKYLEGKKLSSWDAEDLAREFVMRALDKRDTYRVQVN